MCGGGAVVGRVERRGKKVHLSICKDVDDHMHSNHDEGRDSYNRNSIDVNADCVNDD